MAFVLIGVVLVVCNLMDWGPMGAWNWEISGDLWKFVLPFVLATAWWIWSDATCTSIATARSARSDGRERAPRMSLKIVAKESLRVGQPLVVDADSPIGRYATVFE